MVSLTRLTCEDDTIDAFITHMNSTAGTVGYHYSKRADGHLIVNETDTSSVAFDLSAFAGTATGPTDATMIPFASLSISLPSAISTNYYDESTGSVSSFDDLVSIFNDESFFFFE